MKDQSHPPWIGGPVEILNFADSLREDESDTSRRLCFLIIDNAVEMIVRTFLGLPERISNTRVSRNEFQGVSESFPGLLNLLEEKAESRLANVELGEIEYYHRQRNQIYHNGAGITVESSLVEGYFVQASYLLLDLFGVTYAKQPEEELSNFVLEWAKFGRWVRYIAFQFAKPSKDGVTRVPFRTPEHLIQKYIPIELDGSLEERLNKLQKTRNIVAHGLSSLDKSVNAKLLKEVEHVWEQFDKSLEKISKIDITKARKGFGKHLEDESVTLSD